MLRVFVGTNYWSLSGVNIFCRNLTRQLLDRGFDARLLLTEQHTARVALPPLLMDLPGDVPIAYLPAPYDAPWSTRWGRLLRFLERNKPCVIIPNADYRNSGVLSYLSPRVGIAGVVHSDDPLHYDHVQRLGETWDRIVAVSETVREEIVRRLPQLAARTTTIHIGVALPPQRRGPRAAGPLRAVYHGVISIRQKRILDLVGILDACAARGLPISLKIAGTGPDETALRDALREHIRAGRVTMSGLLQHDSVGALLDEADVLLMTSAFEGMPHGMLEAMAHGCVPIVTAIASGPSAVIRHGENGFCAPVGDIAAFVAHIESLLADPERLGKMSAEAQRSIARNRFTLEAMGTSWAELLFDLEGELRAGTPKRPRAVSLLPPASIDGVSIFPIDREVIPGVGEFPVTEYSDFVVESRLGAAGALFRARKQIRRTGRSILDAAAGVPWWRIRHAGVQLRIFLLGFVPRPIKRAARGFLPNAFRRPTTIPRSEDGTCSAGGSPPRTIDDGAGRRHG